MLYRTNALAVRAENVGPFLECQIGSWLAGHDVGSINLATRPGEASSASETWRRR
jgi:hypothetical protein